MRDNARPIRRRGLHPPLLVIRIAFWSSLLLSMSSGAPAQQLSPIEQRQLADLGITCILHDALGRPISAVWIEVRSVAPPLDVSTAATESDGSYKFHGLTAGAYDVTVAGGILLPRKRVQVNSSNDTVVLTLPITLPQAVAQQNATVSVEQLNIPEKAQDALRRAYDAWERGDTRQSRVLATRALQLHPYYGSALSLLGILELQDGHPADAITGLLQAVQYSPNSSRTYLALGSAYNELHQHADALHALSIMAKLVPESWQMHYEVGRAYLGQGRFDAANTEFNHAQQLAPRDPMVLHIGKAHAMLGLHNYSAARDEFEVVIRNAPNGPYAVESREMAVRLDSQLKQLSPNSQAAAQHAAPQRIEH